MFFLNDNHDDFNNYCPRNVSISSPFSLSSLITIKYEKLEIFKKIKLNCV